MNFDHLDDSETIEFDDEFHRSVIAEGSRRRRTRRRRTTLNSCAALLVVSSIIGYGIWTGTRLDRVHVGFDAPAADLSAPFNVLLIGGDARAGEGANPDRADAVMILHVDPISNRISVLSLPRDLALEGAEGPRVAELLEGGPDRLADAVQTELDLPLSAYVHISFDGLVAIADAFGGLDVAIGEDIIDGASGLQLSASECARIDGRQLLAALRSRSPMRTASVEPSMDRSGDAARRARQRALMGVLISQLHRLSADANAFDRIIDVATEDLELDDRIDLPTMVAISRWLGSVHIDVEVEDLPADWTTAQNQRKVLVMNDRSMPMVERLTNGFGPSQVPSFPSPGLEEIEPVLQPFNPCR